MENCLDLECFGLRLARLRESRGISARQMSQNLGMNEKYINQIERGHGFPSMESFYNICEHLGITPKEFFCEDQDDPATTNRLIDLIQQLPPEYQNLIEQFACALSGNK